MSRLGIIGSSTRVINKLTKTSTKSFLDLKEVERKKYKEQNVLYPYKNQNI